MMPRRGKDNILVKKLVPLEKINFLVCQQYKRKAIILAYGFGTLVGEMHSS